MSAAGASVSGALAVWAQEWEWAATRAMVRLIGAGHTLVLLVGVVLNSECDAAYPTAMADHHAVQTHVKVRVGS